VLLSRAALSFVIGLNSIVVLCNIEARQSLGVIYSRKRRSVRSPLKAEGQGPVFGKWSLVVKALVNLYKVSSILDFV
jgi:hypothetical protein